MAPIRLLATDLDGTLIGSANELPLYNTFRDRIQELRSQQGTVWVVCTGRSLHAFKSFFTPMRMMGVMPEFVIIRHAYIFGRTRFGYLPHFLWNLQIAYRIWLSRLHIRSVINEWNSMIGHFSSGVTTLAKTRDRLWFRFDAEESAAAAAQLLREKARPYRHLRVFKYAKEVDVRSVPFTKGLAVSELIQHLDVPVDQVLTIGNGHNDISMLDGKVSRWMGCPINSEPEVIRVIHEAGGHIAQGRALAGVLEIIDAVEQDRVHSALPEHWNDPSDMEGPENRRSPRRSARVPPRVNVWVLLGALYTVLLAFANWNLLPLSRFIVLPFRFVARLLETMALKLWS